jgi:hypothetical protein
MFRDKITKYIYIFLIRMDASQITKLLQKQNTRYINRCQTVDSSTLTWKNQIESSKYIKGVKTCEGAQNCNVPTNPACPDFIQPTGSTQLVTNGINSFGGAGRTTAIQTGSPQQFLNVLSGASGSASEVYSSERILLQKAGKESCGVPGLNPITTTTTDSCGNTITTSTDNTYITLPPCYCDNTNGPMGPRYNVIGPNPGVAQWATSVGASGGSEERIDGIVKDSAGNVYVIGRTTGSATNMNLIVSNYSSVSGAPGSEQVNLSTYGTISLGNQNIQSVFIVKYNQSGQAQWATTINNIQTPTLILPTPPPAQPPATIGGSFSYITIDASDNIYVAVTSGRADPVKAGNLITINNANTTNPGGGVIGITTYATMQIRTNSDMFIVKYDSNGQAQGATQINTITTITPTPALTTADQSYIKGISAGADGIYVTGWSNITYIYARGPPFNTPAVPGYNSIMVYNSAPVSAGTITPTEYGKITPPPPPAVGIITREVIVVKYNFNLQAQWATLIGGEDAQEATSLTTDSLGNVYVSAYLNNAIARGFYIYNFVSAAGGGAEINRTLYGIITITVRSSAIVKFTPNGTCLGVTNIEQVGGGSNPLFVNSMTTDSCNNLCITGYFQSAVMTLYSFVRQGTGNPIITTVFGRLNNSNSGPPTSLDVFIIKYNTNLQVQWATNIGTALIARDEGTDITTDINNNIYITGPYQSAPLRINSYSSVTSGATPTIIVSPQFQMALEGTTSIFLIKYSQTGIAQWATRQGQTDLTSLTRNPLLIDSNYNIYMAGPFNNTTMNIYNYNSLNTATSPPTVNLSFYASLARQSTAADSFLIKYTQPTIFQEIPFPINNQSNPYLPAFDTYYAMKNPQCNYPVQDQNQKHYVKLCNSRFPNANNGVNAVFSPCNNVTELDPVTKQFHTTTSNPPTCEDCIIQE